MDDLKKPMPHVSLLYADRLKYGDQRDEEALEAYSKEIQESMVKHEFPGFSVAFDEIQVVTPRSGVWEDIQDDKLPQTLRSWDVIYTTAPARPLRMVISGGQTGVDQAAWRAAKDAHILNGGWCPETGNNGPYQDKTERPKVPQDFPCRNTIVDNDPLFPDIDRSQRTMWNVRDSDATLVVFQGDQEPSDAGTVLTKECADTLGRPRLLCNIQDTGQVDRVVGWIRKNNIRTLNIGGPADGMPGDPIGAIAEDFLKQVFAQVAATGANR